ncbi:vacuolar sorting protein 9 (VPS9) domain containing protein, putative [Babesia bigemina]|uniref:Vacuolar sorting protein 9 (VPS9) domain containing protein, putative n=1 Tax=Babesia bigemina TaxID=5866 RepID=A0A061D8E0_BABBI|nr:vacuolar sorting protein 9 (VPS9) domain containing protein, putative [Babesia bigemina]CDR94005.1 vacuolar sorting protein 9 (VPS9) domain containing protein, putative [Babesia bigemina]|eukprot:XP_012766191.1 vacuolar sorting protein 9 (VPS9) domain containing protein, putative [Babesia bigemina]
MEFPTSMDEDSATELVTISPRDSTAEDIALDDKVGYVVPSFDIANDGNSDDFSGVFSGGASDIADDHLDVTPSNRANDVAHSDFSTVPLGVSPAKYELLDTPAARCEGMSPLPSLISENDNDSQTIVKNLTPYNRFLDRLKHASCVDIIRAVKGVMAMLPGKMSRADAAAVVHNFIDIYTPRLLATAPFASLPDEERAMSAEFFEKFTMQKLYPQCYSMDPKDRIEDERLWIKMRCLDWVEPKHLEVSSSVDVDLLKDAQEQLNHISRFKAPRDKMVAILNCCRLVVHALEGSSNKPASADETLPLLIYVTVRANPHELWSSIEFIQHFRHPSRHIAEEAYGFTLLVSAVEYIKSIGSTTCFKMDPEEFNRLFTAAQEPYLSRLQKLQEAENQVQHSTPAPSGALVGAEDSVLARLKRIAQPALMFKTALFKNLASSEIRETLDLLSGLETYMVDIPLIFKPDDDPAPDSAAILSDWRALTAMRTNALETVGKAKAILSKLAQ